MMERKRCVDGMFEYANKSKQKSSQNNSSFANKINSSVTGRGQSYLATQNLITGKVHSGCNVIQNTLTVAAKRVEKEAITNKGAIKKRWNSIISEEANRADIAPNKVRSELCEMMDDDEEYEYSSKRDAIKEAITQTQEPKKGIIADRREPRKQGFAKSDSLFMSVSGKGEQAGSIYGTKGRIRLMHKSGPQISIRGGIDKYVEGEIDEEEAKVKLDDTTEKGISRILKMFDDEDVRLVEYKGEKLYHTSRGKPKNAAGLSQDDLNMLYRYVKDSEKYIWGSLNDAEKKDGKLFLRGKIIINKTYTAMTDLVARINERNQGLLTLIREKPEFAKILGWEGEMGYPPVEYGEVDQDGSKYLAVKK